MNELVNTIFYLCYGSLFFYSLYFYNEESPSIYQRVIFSIYSYGLILFSIFRPMGAMRDDRAYSDTFEYLCELERCQFDIFTRDSLWYFFVWIGKSIANDHVMLLLLSGIALFIKLFVVYKLCNKLMLALFFYVGIFYQLHDLTQLRLSLAVSFLMLFFYYYLKPGGEKASFIFLMASWLAHTQAVLGAALLLHRVWTFNYYYFVFLCVIFLTLMTVGLHPNLEVLSNSVTYLIGDSFLYDSIYMYIERAYKGFYLQHMVVPIIFYLSIAAYILLINDVQHKNLKLASISSFSLLCGLSLAFLFTSISDVQVRMYEYFSIVGVLLAGNTLKANSFWIASGLSFLYFSKYNIFWSIWDFSSISL